MTLSAREANRISKINKNFIPFSRPFIEEDDIREVTSVLQNGWLTTGPRARQLERDFMSYKNAAAALALNSCTAALHLALLVSNIKRGDEVITTPMTFCATINTIIHSGATPVLADIDPETMNIDPKEVLKKITPRTKAILPVHFAGRACEMNPLREICSQYQLVMIEDCAHAIESEYRAEKTGVMGDFGCFSFYATKNLTTGEGGVLLAKDQEALSRARKLSQHGMDQNAWKRHSGSRLSHYDIEEPGYKYNMSDVQAALGIRQLEKIEKYSKRRAEIWNHYNEAFRGLAIKTPKDVRKTDRHAHHLYTILIHEKQTGISRDVFLEKMKDFQIGLSIHYLSIPEHSYYQKQFGWRTSDFPHAKQIGERTVSLPLYPGLKDEHVDHIVDRTKKTLDL